ncbi:DUF3078 domain-containing protein [Maribellus sp. YY47]|uniref:DUF3078 domain-containing protein n=1 Tax=Maribellus sp. YY47 TaxID=2929486 RepID=UPI002000E7F1|nr:DUF3078 domain-containing protein [Maribellus sp. YY47]MCK3684904.1 DUF3078 domain-containing protein [Maribellus sp. YY47]
MFHFKKSILFVLLGVLFFQYSYAQELDKTENEKALEDGIRILRNYFLEDRTWHLTQKDVHSNITGLINFLEDAPIDAILQNLNQAQMNDSIYVFRLPENVKDSLSVPGYVSASLVQRNIEKIIADYTAEVTKNPIPVPERVIIEAKQQAPVVPEGKGLQLFSDSIYSFPKELVMPEVIPDSVLNSPEQFKKLVAIDSLRNVYVENKRLAYNDSITSVYVNRMSADYRNRTFEEQIRFRIKSYKDVVALSNYDVLKAYNSQQIALVNDSIRSVINILTAYADYIDTATIAMTNMNGEGSEIVLQKDRERYARVWLKNEQKDSLQLLVKSTGKREMQFLINDGVTFNRFSERQTKDFDFESLKGNHSKFTKVGNAYELETPWSLGGDGNAGFTQTYYENWKKGGQNALSILLVLKGFANYGSANGKKKWENSVEIRNGWMKPGGGEEVRKNDDKFEVTSRFGLSAFRKWYYSTELNFNTQFFRGFRYPKANNPDPISAFLGPSKTIFKIGLDYKPSNKFSMLLSPISLKNVYVRDTALIDQVKYGIPAGKKAFWEVGLNADINMNKKITNDITWNMKYKTFMNYRNTFDNLDMELENQVSMKLNDYMNMTVMLHMIYDANVMFPIYDDTGAQVGQKSKLQLKEFITLGFNYKINKKIMKTRRVR